MVAIDLDGTLLTDDKKITNENIKVLREIYDLGVEIVIATGRRYWSAKNLVKSLGLDLIILANNGNIIRKISNDELLVTKYLNKEDFNKLIEKGKELELHPIVHVDHYNEGFDFVLEFDKDDERYYSYLSMKESRYILVDDLTKFNSHRILVTCYTGDYEILKDFQQNILKEYPNRFNTHIMESTKIGAILEFMNPLGSKWLTLQEYARTKGIRKEEIIAVGDDNNDVEMIQKVGLGIGMKNGTKLVKEAADIITSKTNNESGAADILSKIFNIQSSFNN